MIVLKHDSLVGLLGSSDLLPDDESLEVNVGVLSLDVHASLRYLARRSLSTLDELVDNLSLRVMVVVQAFHVEGIILLFLVRSKSVVIDEVLYVEQLRLVRLLLTHVLFGFLLDLLSLVEASLEEGVDSLLIREVQDLWQVEHKSILVWSVVVSESIVLCLSLIHI